MITAKPRHADAATAGLLLAYAMSGLGCAALPRRAAPPPPALPPITIAVAPARNLSGSRDFEPLRVADLMASELTQLPGVRVLGVNRVLAVLARDNVSQITSPAHAVQVAERLGADAIIVFAITEYDPYDPPIVGIAAELFAARDGIAKHDRNEPDGLTQRLSPPPGPLDLIPRGESQHVFNAADRSVAKDVARFADERDADASPFGPRLYLVSQEHFLRYCCSVTASELLGRRRRVRPSRAEPGMEPTG